MNDNTLTLIFIIETIAIYLLCYLIAFKIYFYKKKRNATPGKYFRPMIAHAVCFFFFIAYGLITNNSNLRIKFLEPLWFVLTPLSFIALIRET